MVPFRLHNGIPKPLVVISVCLILLVVICVGVPKIFRRTSQQPICKDCNVLVISLDSCAAKHMECYGYGTKTSENFCALGKNGAFFQHAYTNATWTLPSNVSMFTGVYPEVHGVNTVYTDRLDSQTPFLPDILHQKGYRTVFFTSDSDFTFPFDTVYTRGIDERVSTNYDHEGYFERAVNTLLESEQKTFVFFHTYACHGPYYLENSQDGMDKNVYTSDIPLRWQDVYQASFSQGFYEYLIKTMPGDLENGYFKMNPYAMEGFIKSLQKAKTFSEAKRAYDAAERNSFWGEYGMMTGYKENYFYWMQIDTENPDHIRFIKAAYDQRLRQLDENIGKKLRDAMANEKLKNNTVVVITADHGEEFMEHEKLGHTTLFDDNTQVPLFLLVPGIQPVSIEENVQSVDITPTILEVLGIPNSYPFNGKSLVPLFFGKSFGERLMIASGNAAYQQDTMTIRKGDIKVFVKKDGAMLIPYLMFNIKKDPQEEKNILEGNIKTAMRMIEQYKKESTRWEKLQ